MQTYWQWSDGIRPVNWSSPADIAGGVPTAIDSSPLIHDFDGDGRAEIVVGAGSTWVENQNGGIMMFSHDGTPRWPVFVFRDNLDSVAATPPASSARTISWP